jgi:hypothetical protein
MLYTCSSTPVICQIDSSSFFGSRVVDMYMSEENRARWMHISRRYSCQQSERGTARGIAKEV